MLPAPRAPGKKQDSRGLHGQLVTKSGTTVTKVQRTVKKKVKPYLVVVADVYTICVCVHVPRNLTATSRDPVQHLRRVAEAGESRGNLVSRDRAKAIEIGQKAVVSPKGMSIVSDLSLIWKF